MKTIAAALSTLAILGQLSACGGSSASDPAPASAPAARFGDCFRLAPGARYLMSDGSTRLNVLENFNDKAETGSTLIAPGGMRLITVYQSFDGTLVRFPGDVEYDATGNIAETSINSETNSLPGDLAPGTTFQVESVETVTEYRNPGSPDSSAVTETRTVRESIRFLGFEDVTLGAQRFQNVCRLSIQDEDGQAETQFWYANGYGLIRQIEYLAPDGAASAERSELVQVLAPAG